MGTKITLFIMAAFMVLSTTGCNSVQTRPSKVGTVEHGIEIPPLEFVTSDAEEIWRGNIGESVVTVFKLKKSRRNDEIVVLTRDRMPEFYKRIEYFDRGGNRTLDYMKMKIYEEGKGWRDVIINKDYAYGLQYANKEYNDILKKIRKSRRR